MKRTLRMLSLLALMSTMMVACGDDTEKSNNNNQNDNPAIEGTGLVTVNWQGEEWTTKSVYATYYEDGGVTLEIYKDPADPEAPLMVMNVPLKVGTYYAVQGVYTFMIVAYDYQGQAGHYNGMDVPPYQPVQGPTLMEVTAVDADAHLISGRLEGEFVLWDAYNEGDDTFYPLTMDFSAVEFIDMVE